MIHYLIVFDRARGEVLRIQPFTARRSALKARFDAETEFQSNGDIEVVVLGASSEDALSQTHSRYFKGLGQLVRAALPSTA